MALENKRYEKFYNTTGSSDDKIESGKLADIEAMWDVEKAEGCAKYVADPIMAPLIFQMQQMQDELDALRTEIALNKDKTTFPGIGTSGSTCLAGNTTTISTAQANAITANTAKVTFPSCTTNVEGSTASITGFAHGYDSRTRTNSLKINVTITDSRGLSSLYSTTLTLR